MKGKEEEGEIIYSLVWIVLFFLSNRATERLLSLTTPPLSL